MGRVRIHQHVNPLAKYYRELPVEPIVLKEVFEKPEQRILLDIGCGRGRFLLRMAKTEPGRNYIGVEIREPLVEEANEIAADSGLANIHYYFCNAPLDLETVLEKVPEDRIELVTIQFPDPWFKKRHEKRRMVNERLVRAVKNILSPDGKVFVQTDVEELADEITGHFEEAGFRKTIISENFLTEKTEREISVENRGLPVYRMVFEFE